MGIGIGVGIVIGVVVAALAIISFHFVHKTKERQSGKKKTIEEPQDYQYPEQDFTNQSISERGCKRSLKKDRTNSESDQDNLEDTEERIYSVMDEIEADAGKSLNTNYVDFSEANVHVHLDNKDRDTRRKTSDYVDFKVSFTKSKTNKKKKTDYTNFRDPKEISAQKNDQQTDYENFGFSKEEDDPKGYYQNFAGASGQNRFSSLSGDNDGAAESNYKNTRGKC